MTETAPSVYIVNQDIVANRLSQQLLNSVNIFSASFQSPNELLDNLNDSSPCCFLLSFVLPEMSGMELMLTLRRQGILNPCIFSSPKIEHELIVKSMHAGSFGFIKRPFQALDFIEHIQKALAYDQKANYYYQTKIRYKNNIDKLSAREKDVLELILKDLSATNIGKTLNLSHRTVENHRNKILIKLGLSKTSELIRVATIYETIKNIEIPM